MSLTRIKHQGKVFVNSIDVVIGIYDIRRNANSSYYNFKKVLGKLLITRHFVIISLFKNCTWLYVLLIILLINKYNNSIDTCSLKIIAKKTECKLVCIINLKQLSNLQTLSSSFKFTYINFEPLYKTFEDYFAFK